MADLGERSYSPNRNDTPPEISKLFVGSSSGPHQMMLSRSSARIPQLGSAGRSNHLIPTASGTMKSVSESSAFSGTSLSFVVAAPRPAPAKNRVVLCEEKLYSTPPL